MPPVGFEPKISAGEQPHTHGLDRAATGTGQVGSSQEEFREISFVRGVNRTSV